jgi:hypothetical protein
MRAANGAAHDQRRFTMKYLLALIGDESGMANRTPEAQRESMRAWDSYTQELIDAGAHLGGEGLQPSATATTVKLSESGGDPVVTDGPFAETKEQLAGFYVLDCKDLDEAIEVASKHPLARRGAMELRPFGAG